MHAEVFRNEVIIKSAVYFQVVQSKKKKSVYVCEERGKNSKCDKMLSVEPRWGVYGHSLYRFFNFFICMNTFKIKAWRKGEDKF